MRSNMGQKLIVQNKKAWHNYFLTDTFEAGLVLVGTEVKSLRNGKASIAEAFVQIKNGEAWLHGATIPQYENGNRNNHEETRVRKLLLNKKEIEKIDSTIKLQRVTVVPTKMYFSNGKAKIEIALGKGKKLHDKRQSDKERDVKKKLSQGKYDV